MRVATRPTARLVSGSSAVSASPSSVTVCATTWSTWTCSSLSCIIQLLEKDDTPRRPAPGVLPAERAGVGTRPCPPASVSYTHLRAHETRHDLVCRLLLE